MSDQQQIPDFILNLQKAAETKSKGKSNSSKSSSSDPENPFINMRNWDNHGKVSMVLFSTKDGRSGMETIMDLGVVEKWISGTTKEGKEYGFVKKMYLLPDPRMYGNLTDEQKERHDKLKSKLNSVPSNRGVYKQDMTLLTGYILEHKDRSNKVLHQNVPATLSIISKKFSKNLNAAINTLSDKLKRWDWIERDFVNSELTRKRYLEFDLYMDQSEGAGYLGSVNVAKFDEDTTALTGGKEYFDISSNPEIIEKFENPFRRLLQFKEDVPLFDDEYLTELEQSLNMAIRGEAITETRTPEQGEPEKANSNESYREEKVESSLPQQPFSSDEEDFTK